MTLVDQRVPNAAPSKTWDVAAVRKEFPLLQLSVRGKPLAYLDNAATSQKPRCVIEALKDYYETGNANIHRGVYQLSERATAAYEGARVKVQQFINAGSAHEIVFVRGCTEAINLVAGSFGRVRMGPEDEILVTAMEHHSNIVPWQILSEATGARLRVAPMDQAGSLLLGEFERLLSSKTKLVALVHVSNSLGTINPVKQLCEMAHSRGATVLVDGAQAVPHMPVNVREIECDFYCISSHKMFGPTGMGVLYAREELLNEMPPYQGGGDMIRSVSFESSTYAPPPSKFEAGTPHIAGAVGLAAAIDFLSSLDWELIHEHEQDLLTYATTQLSAVPGLRIIGQADPKASVVSFIVDGVHAHDIGTVVDQEGVAIRTGHHCTQPVMDFYGVPATARASFALYNTRQEIDTLVAAVKKARAILG
ncbi:MAG: aminotransferase class V-fold PLP-dependent enzyme [Gemmatimonadales bacterium]